VGWQSYDLTAWAIGSRTNPMQFLLNTLLEPISNITVRNALITAALNRLPMLTDQSLNHIKRISHKIHVSAENQPPTHSKVQSTPASGIG